MSLDQFAHAAAPFSGAGELTNHSVVAQLQAQVLNKPITELLVLCHGWNNNSDQARSLYDDLLDSLLAVDTEHGNGQLSQRLAILALYWPSKQFDFARREQPATGAAAAFGASGDEQALIAALEDLRALEVGAAFTQAIDQSIALVPQLEDLRSARDAFVATLLPVVANEHSGSDSDLVDQVAGDEPPASLTTLTGREVLDRLGRPLPPALQPEHDRAPRGGAAGGVGRGAIGGAFSLVNLLTFWKMKQRAGAVGRRGLAPLLRALQQDLPQLRVHLAGHSFGARLLTTAVLANTQQHSMDQVPVHSLSLLQGAFSHNGFARGFHNDTDGAFRAVLTKHLIQGPILATHTRNDRAVGLAYPMASRLSRDDASAIGDADDRFGGIGSNGAVHTPEAVAMQLQPPGTPYNWLPGRIHNLRADAHIKGHSDIKGTAVAAALLAALA